MKVTFYINTAENNRVDKTAYLQQVIEVEGSLRTDCSLLSPVIVFEFPNLNPSPIIDEDDEEVVGVDSDIVIDSDVFYRFNYAYIKEFERYYFVQDVIIQRSKVFNVFMSCDVLMSFRNDIRSLNAFVERNEFQYDPLLPDALLSTETMPVMEELPLIHGGNKNISFSSTLDAYDDFNVALSIANNSYFGNARSIDAPIGTSLPDINRDAFTYPSSRVYALTNAGLGGLSIDMILHSSINDFILGVVAFPFDIELYDPDLPSDNVHISVPDTEGLAKLVVLGNTKGKHAFDKSDYLVLGDFTFPVPTDYLECDPDASYALWIPFVGVIDLSARELGGHPILVYYAVDYQDGSATAYVYDDATKKVIYNASCQIGIPVSLTKTNAEQNRQAMKNLQANAIFSVIGGSISSFAQFYSGDPGKAIGSATKTITGAVGDYLKSLMIYPSAKTSSNGSMFGLYQPLELHLFRVRRKVIPDLTKYAHQFGRPTRDVCNLVNLRGFTIVSEIHLENINAFKKEKEEIERLLKLGVIL